MTLFFSLQELDKNNVKNASLVLSGLHKFGKTLSIQAADGVTVMIKQGLVDKISIKM